MKTMKKFMCVLLVVLMCVTSAPLGGFNFTAEAVDYKVGDIIQFGSYPQSKVTDSATITALNNKAPAWDNWKSYGYYSGTGDYGSMVQGDWMRYTDIMYNGNKYRGVKFTQYRPSWTYKLSAYSLQDDNGYSTNTVYWFKFESIDWRVLDPISGLVMCETIIDSQPYSNTIYYNSAASDSRYAYFNDSSYKNYASDYETSSIRKWLNDDFYNTAFTDSEKKEISTTSLNNDSYYTSNGTTGYEELDSYSTNDRIFLLSYNEVRNSDFGFNSSSSVNDTARFAQGSDYAQCQGLLVYKNSDKIYNGNSDWLLRSPGSNGSFCCFVFANGESVGTYVGGMVFFSDNGVRPALNLNRISGIVNPVDPDNPNDDNSNDENTDISIKFKPDAYEVEVDYTVTLSATVNCPAGVENSDLDMVWEIIDPDGTELLYDGEYSVFETKLNCYAEIRGLKAGTYFVNLCDKNSGVFDTAEIHVYEYYHPETPPKPYIQCDNTTVEYKQNVDIDNRKKFTINGHITNYNEEHTLTDISITIKSPDANKAVFKTDNGYEASVTFPLDKTIEVGKARDFKCTAYVKRGYNPPNGTEDLTFTCILHGKLDGKEVNGIYRTFKVKIINLSYDVPEDPKGGWRSITMIELLDFLFTSRDPKGVLYIDRYPGRGSYNVDDLELKSRYTAIKAIGAVQSTIELSEALNEQLEAAINVTELGNISAIKMHKAIIGIGQEALNVLFDAYKDKAKKKLSAYYNKEIQDLLESEIFDHYLKWYSDEVNYINGNTTKITKRCPIDIYVTDEEGYNVLQITDSNIKIFDEYADAYLSGDEKILYLPNDIGHSIKTVATDNGEMDYIIESYSKQGEYRIIEYDNIPLMKGKSYTATVPLDMTSNIDMFNPKSEDGKIIKADKDETEHKYGDKDKNCQLCGYDRTEGCSCNCHKGGIKGFFFKFLLFFQKIFRTNKVCKCGINHY